MERNLVWQGTPCSSCLRPCQEGVAHPTTFLVFFKGPSMTAMARVVRGQACHGHMDAMHDANHDRGGSAVIRIEVGFGLSTEAFPVADHLSAARGVA